MEEVTIARMLNYFEVQTVRIRDKFMHSENVNAENYPLVIYYLMRVSVQFMIRQMARTTQPVSISEEEKIEANNANDQVSVV